MRLPGTQWQWRRRTGLEGLLERCNEVRRGSATSSVSSVTKRSLGLTLWRSIWRWELRERSQIRRMRRSWLAGVAMARGVRRLRRRSAAGGTASVELVSVYIGRATVYLGWFLCSPFRFGGQAVRHLVRKGLLAHQVGTKFSLWVANVFFFFLAICVNPLFVSFFFGWTKPRMELQKVANLFEPAGPHLWRRAACSAVATASILLPSSQCVQRKYLTGCYQPRQTD